MADAFFPRVYEVVGRVPRGRVVTYGQIAQHLGQPNGARAVGWAMRQCPEALPWHRVVNSAGRSSLRGDGAALQRSLLADEGVAVGPSGAVDLAVFGWDEI
ncbi:MAG: methylated-DNA--[protein]-cysteine S-methyltransferase [Chloroflexi bacterium]|jgi:methylated-DNA-protein-cysteine methyltransferase-like protein|nr:methylated-DNA--[protein]-cysteine S-methyltransferase [Chloroflexota bacterium]